MLPVTCPVKRAVPPCSVTGSEGSGLADPKLAAGRKSLRLCDVTADIDLPIQRPAYVKPRVRKSNIRLF